MLPVTNAYFHARPSLRITLFRETLGLFLASCIISNKPKPSFFSSERIFASMLILLSNAVSNASFSLEAGVINKDSTA